MSCRDGEPCLEDSKRRRALWVLLLMALIFAGLSFFSFTAGRQQAVPAAVHYAGHDAVAGRKVFQSWNCMGCHTIVGNGAYFGPDLTNIYQHAGPAWLAAFLPSAGGWPTAAAVRVQLQAPAVKQSLGTLELADYLQQFPGAAERVERRGGQHSYMPNLALSKEEVEQLIAFFKYTAAMHNEGWPPLPKVDGLQVASLRRGMASTPAVTAEAAAKAEAATNSEADSPSDPATLGAALVRDNGCLACHSTGQERIVGPGWAGLSGSQVELAAGGQVTADADYLARKIRQPTDQPVAGYPAGVMPAFANVLNESEVTAIVAYLQTL
ncbi:MAG: c-type cytochrome [Sterolibacterium sp.]|nr:c-type cytochrome [Sterolibacterium sp.]